MDYQNALAASANRAAISEIYHRTQLRSRHTGRPIVIDISGYHFKLGKLCEEQWLRWSDGMGSRS